MRTLDKRVEKLGRSRTRQEQAQREGTTQTYDTKGKIVQFLWHMEKENKSRLTLASYAKYLNMLIKIGTDLLNPDSVKEKVAK